VVPLVVPLTVKEYVNVLIPSAPANFSPVRDIPGASSQTMPLIAIENRGSTLLVGHRHTLMPGASGINRSNAAASVEESCGFLASFTLVISKLFQYLDHRGKTGSGSSA